MVVAEGIATIRYYHFYIEVREMTSNELKYQANLQKWAAAIQQCRSSGVPVKQWCRKQGIGVTTYYRWERKIPGIADTAKAVPHSSRTGGNCAHPGYQH